jgi:hypothetical protein
MFEVLYGKTLNLQRLAKRPKMIYKQNVERLADRSEKPGDDLCFGFVPDPEKIGTGLQRIAATNVEQCTTVNSPYVFRGLLRRTSSQ